MLTILLLCLMDVSPEAKAKAAWAWATASRPQVHAHDVPPQSDRKLPIPDGYVYPAGTGLARQGKVAQSTDSAAPLPLQEGGWTWDAQRQLWWREVPMNEAPAYQPTYQPRRMRSTPRFSSSGGSGGC